MQTLQIEWKHYENAGETCVRCSETGQELQKVVTSLVEECRPHGWDIQLKITKLTEQDIAESNIILINGQPIENILKDATSGESQCDSCGELMGQASVCCRTIEIGEKSYEGISSELIREAVCKIAQCC